MCRLRQQRRIASKLPRGLKCGDGSSSRSPRKRLSLGRGFPLLSEEGSWEELCILLHFYAVFDLEISNYYTTRTTKNTIIALLYFVNTA